MKYLPKRMYTFGRNIKCFPIENDWIPEPDNDDSFPVLWDKVCPVNNFHKDLISEIPQGALNNIEGTSFVVGLQILHVFQHEGPRTFLGDDSGHVKK